MLYGQNLPWRLALRNVTRSSIRHSSSASRLYSTSRQRQIPTFATSLSLRPSLSSCATSGTSKFTTSPSRRKESKDPKDPVVEETTEENAQKKADKVKEAGGEEVAEAKSKTAESSTQSGNATSGGTIDGRGSSGA